MITTSPKPKTLERRKHGKEPYSALRLSIEMDDIAAWLKRHKPDWTPEKLADELRAEVERIEEEMTDGTF